jgi:hypothetical protein
MDIMGLLRSQRVAFVFMSFVIAFAIVLAKFYFGWFGVGLVGLLGLVISLRAEIFDRYGDPHERSCTHVVQMYSRQLDNRQFENCDAQLRRQGEDFRRDILHRAVNTVPGAIMFLGMAMYLVRVV